MGRVPSLSNAYMSAGHNCTCTRASRQQRTAAAPCSSAPLLGSTDSPTYLPFCLLCSFTLLSYSGGRRLGNPMGACLRPGNVGTDPRWEGLRRRFGAVRPGPLQTQAQDGHAWAQTWRGGGRGAVVVVAKTKPQHPIPNPNPKRDEEAVGRRRSVGEIAPPSVRFGALLGGEQW